MTNMKTLLILLFLHSVTMTVPRDAAAQDTAARQDWQVYPPSGMPSGTNVTEGDAASLTERELSAQAHYLMGTFRVTARAEDRVVLRTDGKEGGARVVALYPPSIPTPAEGEKVVRDATCGFRIIDIRRGGDGQLTIYVRNITRPKDA